MADDDFEMVLKRMKRFEGGLYDEYGLRDLDEFRVDI
jgi:hypothetical protein